MIDLTFSIEDGDCAVILDDENMVEACVRRLDTRLDSTLYDEYGSDLGDLLGLRKSDVNLQFLSQSIQSCLSQDERLSDISVDCEYSDTGIVADISAVYEDNVLEFTYENNTEDVGDGD